MKIKHIIDRLEDTLSSWRFYWEKDRKHEESTSEIYELKIYRHKEDSTFGYRYKLDSYKRNYYRNILRTDSKEEMKITLDLMGLRIAQVDIILFEEDFSGEIKVICSLIDLIKNE